MKLLQHEPIHSISEVARTKYYLGKSNWNGDSNFYAIFDDMKVFKRALTNDEILAEKDKIDVIVYGQLLHSLILYELFSEGQIHYWLFVFTTLGRV